MEEKLYTTVLGEGTAEYTEKKSVFIGYAAQAKTEEEAQAVIRQIKNRYPDARHHVFAYRQNGGMNERYSDDGEPQGSAGVPILETIRKSGVDDTVVVVTRYFGGILLGTGGLARAYAHAARDAIDDAKIVTYESYAEYSLECSYADYQRYQNEFLKYAVIVDATDFSERVRIGFAVKEKSAEALLAAIREISNGADTPIFLKKRFDCR